MNDSTVAVAAFARESETTVLDIELGSPLDELLNLARRLMHDQFHHILVTKTITSNECIFNVVIEGIFGSTYAGEPALCIGAVAFGNPVLGGNQHRELWVYFQRSAEAGYPRAHHEDIREPMEGIL